MSGRGEAVATILAEAGEFPAARPGEPSAVARGRYLRLAARARIEAAVLRHAAPASAEALRDLAGALDEALAGPQRTPGIEGRGRHERG